MLRRGAAATVEMRDGSSPDAQDSPDVPGAPFPVALAARSEQVAEFSVRLAVRLAGLLPAALVLVAQERVARALVVALPAVPGFSAPLPDEPATREPHAAQALPLLLLRESSEAVASSPSVSAQRFAGSDWLPDGDGPAVRRAAMASAWSPRGGWPAGRAAHGARAALPLPPRSRELASAQLR